jgi:outer membrane protein TolC
MKVFFFFCTITCCNIYAITFQEAVERLSKHELILSIESEANELSENAKIAGSWGDPNFKISAKNFPKDTFKSDETPMTGVEFGISQKFSLTTKYRNRKDSLTALSNATESKAKDKGQLLLKRLWNLLITIKRTKGELKILSENQAWLNKTLKISKKLYANGKTTQQAILDIQIRHSEIGIELNNKKIDLSQLHEEMNYLIGESEISFNSIPWQVLDKRDEKPQDHKESLFKEKLRASELNLYASRLNYIPDLTLGVGYTKRSNIDNRGDFVGASLSFPIPTSHKRYSNVSRAIYQNSKNSNDFKNYLKIKRRDQVILEKEISKLNSELKTLSSKTLRFAKNLRTITSKSYGLGGASYIELLQSELKLQNIQMHKLKLEEQREKKKVELKYILGESIDG